MDGTGCGASNQWRLALATVSNSPRVAETREFYHVSEDRTWPNANSSLCRFLRRAASAASSTRLLPCSLQGFQHQHFQFCTCNEIARPSTLNFGCDFGDPPVRVPPVRVPPVQGSRLFHCSTIFRRLPPPRALHGFTPSDLDRLSDRQTTSFIDNSIEAGILLGGNGALRHDDRSLSPALVL